MEVFEFIIILVVITTLGKVAMAVGVPLVDKLGDLMKELAAARKAEADDAVPRALEADAVEELERRLARIEDRLDFIEELKAPDRRRAIGGVTSGRSHTEG
jgi:phage regulator Rha-like protein